jgi:hypothetical protein
MRQDPLVTNDEFTRRQREQCMRVVEAWYDTIDAQGLSYAGMAALLRDIADEFG